MAGYIGSKSSVTQVDGYSEAEADAEFVTKAGDTMSGNLDVTGTVTSDGLTVDGIATFNAPNSIIRIMESDTTDTNTQIQNNGGDLHIQTVVDNLSSSKNRISLDHATGDISFYEDTGTTAKFFWDSSSESLGIGTSSPSSFYSLANNLVVGTGTGGNGLTIYSQNNSSGYIGFNDTASNGMQGFIQYNHSGDYMAFAPNGTEKMRITSSGSVGIGVIDPDSALEVQSSASGANSVHLSNTSSTGYGAKFIGGGNAPTRYIADFRNYSGASKLRLDGGGNLLVNTTNADVGFSTTNGSALHPTGQTHHSSAGTAIVLNRTGSDGTISQFRKDGSTIGNIGVVNGDMYLGTDNTGWRFINSASAIVPVDPSAGGTTRDNAVDLGDSGGRFDDIYATNGTIQTSDFNEKQDIASLTATEMLVGKRISALFKTFRWKDSVAEKGDNARTHTGVIAQDVQAAFTAEGLDAGDYALFISSTWWEHDVDVPAVEAVDEVTDEDGNVTTEAVEAKDAYTRTDTYDTEAEAPEGATSKTRMGIRYPELLSFVAAYNEQRFASIEARLTALEA